MPLLRKKLNWSKKWPEMFKKLQLGQAGGGSYHRRPSSQHFYCSLIGSSQPHFPLPLAWWYMVVRVMLVTCHVSSWCRSKCPRIALWIDENVQKKRKIWVQRTKILMYTKVIYPKYSKHRLSIYCGTHSWLCVQWNIKSWFKSIGL